MGRYKTEKIYYPNRWQPTEDLIADGYYYAQKKPAETIEIAAHIMDAAHENEDEELFNVGRDLMRVANSPCQFIANENAEDATDKNNRPSDYPISTIPHSLLEVDNKIEEEWDSSRDDIFNNKVRPYEIKKAIDGVESEKVSGRPYFFVVFKILKILKYIPVKTTPRDFLLWVNLHFNCGWSENPHKKHQLNFRLEGTIKQLSKKHPSEWKNDKTWGDIGSDYYKLAITLKNAFTQVMDKGKCVDDSESFEHMIDRPQFLRGAQWIFDRYLVTDGAYINDGK